MEQKLLKEQRIEVARIHEGIANAREDYLHKISTELVKKHDRDRNANMNILAEGTRLLSA